MFVCLCHVGVRYGCRVGSGAGWLVACGIRAVARRCVCHRSKRTRPARCDEGQRHTPRGPAPPRRRSRRGRSVASRAAGLGVLCAREGCWRFRLCCQVVSGEGKGGHRPWSPPLHSHVGTSGTTAREDVWRNLACLLTSLLREGAFLHAARGEW